MGYAVTAAGAGGEVICLEKGNFFGTGGYAITQSVTISCGDGLWEAPGQTIPINTPAGSIVSIEGLVIDGAGSSNIAVQFTGQGSLRLHRARIDNSPISTSDGLLFALSGPAKLQVSDSIFYSNGTGSGGGIVINPASGGTAQVALERVTVSGNAFGIAADGSYSTGGINMTIADSMIANNANDGILATTSSGHAPIGVMVENTKSVNDAFSALSIGPNVTIRASNSTFVGNSTGLRFSGGGSLLTFGNNRVRANATDGAFSGPVGLQ